MNVATVYADARRLLRALRRHAADLRADRMSLGLAHLELLDEITAPGKLATYRPAVTDLGVEPRQVELVLDRWIRGSDPSPGAWSEVYGTRLRMFAPRVSTKAAHGEPGSVETADGRAGLEVATGSGLLAIDEVQPAGKRRMQVTEWIRGRGISVGARFT